MSAGLTKQSVDTPNDLQADKPTSGKAA